MPNGIPSATRTGSVSLAPRGEAGEAIGRIGTADAGRRPLRGLYRRGRDRKEDPARRLRERRRLVPHRRSDELDEQGYFHFVDRVGDTFRWKGENVATSEVNDAIRDFPGVLDASTYGVTVPGADGRAGMAAIVVADSFDLKAFAEHLSRRLPAYAIRSSSGFAATLDATETFKRQKQRLIRDGFDPPMVSDALFLGSGHRRLSSDRSRHPHAHRGGRNQVLLWLRSETLFGDAASKTFTNGDDKIAAKLS